MRKRVRGNEPHDALQTIVLGTIWPKGFDQVQDIDVNSLAKFSELRYEPFYFCIELSIQSLEKLRLVRKDSAVLADNIKIPGAPRYLEYLYHGKGYQTWRTSVIDVPFEYRPETPDAMTLSIWRGDSEQSPPPPPPREPCASELSAMRSPTDRLICEAELNSPNDGSAVGA